MHSRKQGARKEGFRANCGIQLLGRKSKNDQHADERSRKREESKTMKTKDRTVNKSLAWLGGGGGSNACHVDALDGRIVRIRPIHFDECYSEEQLRAWSIEKDGHVFKAGDKTFPPPLSLAYKYRAYSPNRVLYPLIREDWDPNGDRNPQNRGESKYRRISWDEAAQICADEIQRIHDTYGPHSIYCQGDGHGEGNCWAGAHGCQINAFGLADGCAVQARQPDSWEGWVWGAKHVWGMEPVGESTGQNNVFKDIVEYGDAVLYWGCDPETAPWGWGGQQCGRMAEFLGEVGVDRIWICPDLNYGAAAYADKWIPVLPNTDAALQLGIIHTWLTDGTYDKEFLDTHSVGFDWIESYVLGRIDDMVPKTPEWAAEKCGVPAYKIRGLARYWAKNAVSIVHNNGGSMIRAAYSHEPARLEVTLLAMQGLAYPGGHQLKQSDMGVMGDGCNPLPPAETSATQLGAYHGWLYDPGESFIVKTKLPQAVLDGHVDWYSQGVWIAPRQSQFDKYEYPAPGEAGICMIWSDAPCWSTCWNCGGLNQDMLRSEQVEFVLVQHPWMENDTRFADIILPIATTFELNDMGTDNNNGQYSMFYFEKKAIEPIGEAVGDYEAVLRVFKKFKGTDSVYANVYDAYSKNEMGYEDGMRSAYSISGADDGTYDFEELFEGDANKFWMSAPKRAWQKMPIGLQPFVDDPANNPLQTPSGLLEFYSQALKDNFPEDEIRAPYPRWVEDGGGHHERLSHERAEKYPYLLCSNHPHWRVHAQHDDLPWLREIETCKVIGPDGYGYEPIWVNPVDAEKLDLANGDIAALFNERGRVLGGIRITERIMPGVLYQDHGARCDAVIPGYGGFDRGGANNLISPHAVTSPNCPGEVTSGYLVGIEKVDVFELAEQYPEAFSRPFDTAVGQITASALVEEVE